MSLDLKLLAVAAVFSATVAGGAYISHLQHEAAQAKVGQAVATGTATVATGQSAATTDAAAIADRGAQRDARTSAAHEEHAHAIQAAAGANAALDPAVVAAVRRGLCDYDAYASDPGCTGLRGGDPAQLPPTD